MTDFNKIRNIRLINNVIAHEVGHLIANLLLNDSEDGSKATQISINWIEHLRRPGGQINYSRKEGSKYWRFPEDLNLCYTSLLSLYSGCIWEKFFDSIFHHKVLSMTDIENCLENSGGKDMEELNFINNLHLKRILSKEFTRENIIEPYIKILQDLPEEKKLVIYDQLKIISSKVDSHFSSTDGELKYTIKEDEFANLKIFILKEFVECYKNDLLKILDNIKKFIKLE